jgi:NADPH-dependent 2,4-dienoyl-CoA reductase/sulfur reductase-like enzyme
MPHYPYLIIGGGMTAAAAAQGIREADPAAVIGLIGAEPDPPYDRPPLTKGLWKGEPLDGIWRPTERQGVTAHLGREARELDPARRRVVDDQGTEYTYEALLLATGGTPRRLPFGGDGVLYYRTVADYRRLRALTERGRQRFVVVGGGFIGTEIAAALAMNGQQVALVFPAPALGARVYPEDLGAFLTGYYREKGVEVVAQSTVTGLEPRGDRWAVTVRPADESGSPAAGPQRVIEADGVVAGLGIQPNVALAEQAGLAVEDGILVDEHLRTSQEAIYAAGDVARFPNPALGRRVRVEHEDNANTMGAAAGRNMAGAARPYTHLPFFYSDLFDLGYEAVGDLDAGLETVADWKEPHREGVVYYLGDGRVRGVLLWNVWEQVDAARRLIAEPGPFRAQDLPGRLPAAP